MLFRPALISALALAAAPLFSAQAAILDLTDRSVFAGGPAAGSWINNIDGTGINVFIESAGGSMNTRENGPRSSQCPADPALACESDGVGIGDDEITFRRNESITLTFSQSVDLTGLYFLDLFRRNAHSTHSADIETAISELFTGNDQLGFQSIGTLNTDATSHRGSGFAAELLGLPTRIDRLVISASGGRDDGSSDFALAGLSFAVSNDFGAPVPVPAALPLFAAVAGVFASARRRKQA